MSKKEMPAAEASELQSYELAFHVLPTVAEGEVTNVFQALKDIITKQGGEITNEEEPARFDLAYDIVKYLEGRHRNFSSAYFGWIRFTVDPSQVETISAEVDSTKELLRYLLIKLTKQEEENPFFFHEAIKESKSETIDLDEDEADEKEEKEEEKADDSDEESKEEAKDESETKTKEDGEESEDKV